MGIYLNPGNRLFEKDLNKEIFIDKSMMIRKLNQLIGTSDQFINVTRPRRFGKTMAVSMIEAYYSKSCDSKELFQSLKISKDKTFLKHLNQHNVISIDMGGIYATASQKNDTVETLQRLLIKDLKTEFSDCLSDETTFAEALESIYVKTSETFIILIDEWDVILREEKENTKLIDSYMFFLRSLFKNSRLKPAIDLAYMTGILPIRRYNTQSSLNEFMECNMLDPDEFAEFIGFTESEVLELCNAHAMQMEDMKKWYNGYAYDTVGCIYNPKSVVTAIQKKSYNDYWTKTSSTESVTEYMNYDSGELKEEIIKLIAGERVMVNVSRFSNDLTKINSKDAALTVLIHLGYLAYDRNTKTCYIPNYEIKQEFENAIEDLHWMDIYHPIMNSKEILEQTIAMNESYVANALDAIHDQFSTVLSYNKEDVLSTIVYLAYYLANREYTILKETNTGKGRADLIYIPYKTNKPCLVIELKVNTSVQSALEQIKNKEYPKDLKAYAGNMLLVGISYDSVTKKHTCKIEKTDKE